MPSPALTPAIACARLEQLGLRLAPDDLQIDAREERWVVHLPKQRVAWFAASAEGLRRLALERRVLRLLEARCTFSAPRVLLEDPSGEVDVRAMVPGVSAPWRVYAEACKSRALAASLGAAIGAILAEQHARIGAGDVAGWLPRRAGLAAAAGVGARAPARVVDYPALLADADALMEAYEATPVAEADRALVHTDVGFHNLGIDRSPSASTASSTTRAPPGPIATTTFATSCSIATATSCSTPRSRSTSRSWGSGSSAAGCSCTTPPAR